MCLDYRVPGMRVPVPSSCDEEGSSSHNNEGIVGYVKVFEFSFRGNGELLKFYKQENDLVTLLL